MSGPSKAALQAEALELELDTSGTNRELIARITAERARRADEREAAGEQPPPAQGELDTELPTAEDLEPPGDEDPLVTAAIAAARTRSAGGVACVAIAIAGDGEIVAIDNVDNPHAGRARADELVAIARPRETTPLVVSVEPGYARAQTWTDDGEISTVARAA